MPPFHLAIPVNDLAAARAFYGGVLGCPEGRSAERWIDFDIWGHQLTVHLADGGGTVAHNPVDGDDVPIPHFGVVLSMSAWKALAKRLEAADQQFLIAPHIRFKDEPGEQATMFLLDPSGNAIEFKALAGVGQLFAH